MINLSTLDLKNFLSHVDTHISFDDYEGLVLVEGQSKDGHYSSNGSGKSTLLEGIVYALTGDTLRGVSVNDVVNRNYKKNTMSSLKFRRDNEGYVASRYRKDDIHGDNLILIKDEENISKRVNKETQKSLEDILGISYKILVSTILLGEGLSSRFTQLSDPEKKSLIESTLNLNYDISKIRDKANSAMKSLNIELATINGEVSVLSKLQDIDIDLFEDSISDNENCIKIYEKTVEMLALECKNLTEEIDSISPKISLINDTLHRISTLERDREVKATEVHRLNQLLNEIISAEIPTCALCRQSLQSPESKKAVIDQYTSNMNILYKEIEVIDAELSQLPDKNILVSKSGSLSKDYEEKSSKYRETLQEYNSYKYKIAESQKDIERARSDIESARDSHSHLEEKLGRQKELQSSISKYEYFYNLFSPTGIIVNILSDAIDYINDRLATYSEVLLEKDYKINFLKGKISLVDSKGSSYQSLSNGEKRRLDIAIQFSLHDYVCTYCGNNVDTMFIDEILDTLDDVGIENIITVLRLKLDYCKLSRIFVISHNSELKSYFDNVITVYKDDAGNSKILS